MTMLVVKRDCMLVGFNLFLNQSKKCSHKDTDQTKLCIGPKFKHC